MASRAASLVLVAGALVISNDALFSPLAGDGRAPWKSLNWRLIPATGILAVSLAGLETLAPAFAVGLAGLTIVAVLIVPYGHAPSVVDNVSKILGYK